MIELVPYDPSFESITLHRISDFFGFHQSLLDKTQIPVQDTDSRSTLVEWLDHPNALFIILYDDNSVGFIRINYRGPNAAWIEDIFVDPIHRGRGFASSAISLAETIVQKTPGYIAVCLDVSPRNEDALRLYHKLGYLDLSLITLRKNFKDSKRDRPIHILNHDFRY